MTSSTALSTGKVADANTPVSAPTKLTLPDTTNQLINDSGAACNNGSNPSGNGKVPLIYAFTVSCNTVFGALGEQVGGAALRDQANKFGMNDPNLTIPLPVAPSNYPPVSAPSLTAYSAIGQYSDTVTPLQEAMFSAAVANNGTLIALGGDLNLTGALTGAGVVKFDTDVKNGGTINPVGARLDVTSVAAGETITMNGDNILVLNTPAAFAGSIAAKVGDRFVLTGVTAASAVATGVSRSQTLNAASL